MVYFLCAPSFGAINDVALNGGEQHTPGVLHKHKVSRLADLPAVAREKISQHLQRVEYEVSRFEKALPSGETSSYRASNRKQNLNAYFTSQGVHVLPTGQGTPVWHLEMHFSGYGYDGAMRQAKQERLDAIEVSGNRVEYQRGTLTEWYVNDEQGLEQGMTLHKVPGGKGTGPLVIEWTVSGDLVPRIEPQGGIIFRRQDGEAVLSYGGLEAWDATGRSLPAKLSVNIRRK